MSQEIWKDIVGFEGLYQVSDMGNVKSLSYKKTGISKNLKGGKQYNGYLRISLCKNNFICIYSVHRLVAQAFITNPKNKPQVNHKNGIRDDNRVENLEWCTASENHLHKFRVLKYIHPGTGKFGKDNHRSKKVNQYDLDGNFIKTWDSTIDVQRGLGLYCTHVGGCCRGERKTTGGYKWKYKVS